MLDFLVALAQFACLIGLGYGAFLCFAHHDCVDDLRAHYDPISRHDWLALKPDERELQLRVVGMTPEETAAPDRRQTA